MNHRRELNEFEREQRSKTPRKPHPYGELHLAIIALVFAALSAWLLYREAILPWAMKTEIIRWTFYIISLLGVAVLFIVLYIRRITGKIKTPPPMEPHQLKRNAIIWSSVCAALFFLPLFVTFNHFIYKDIARVFATFAFIRASHFFKAYRKAKAEVSL